MTTATTQPGGLARALPGDLPAYRRLMVERFGYRDFRDGQADVLSRLAASDVLAVMPTGSGKSLCYVLPALVAGRAVVVSPLIALMQDQVESLRASGVAAAFINSSLGNEQKNEVFRRFRDGDLDLLYVAPESLARDRFVGLLARAGVNLLAIDEAHCVSEWGHDFRPDYLALGSVRERLGRPRTLALTATAEPQVRDDIAARLGIEGAERVVTSVNRPNLKLAVEVVERARDRLDWLIPYLRARPGQSGIVYVRSRRGVETVAEALAGQGFGAAAYHAGMPSRVRAEVQRRFITDRVPVIVATNAFGLGINKPDVRFVVHFDMPGRLETYYQEAGRAGRDGEPAECTLLYGSWSARQPQRFVEAAHPTEAEVRQIWARLLALSRRAPGAEGRAPVPDLDRSEENGLAMALRALRDSGLIDPTGRRLLSSDPAAPIDATVVARHRQYAEDRLWQMVGYAEADECRKSVILRYFGEQPAGPCGECDRCLPAAAAPELQCPEELHRMLLDLRDRIAARRGYRPERVFQDRTAVELAMYRPHDLDELLATWGIRARKAKWYGAQLLDLIREWESRNPDAPDRAARPPSRRRLRAAEPIEPIEGSPDGELFERLRAWRLERARRDGVPAYTIFWNRTLAELARARPTNLAELSGIFGMGSAKLDRYSAELLAIIRGDGQEGGVPDRPSLEREG